MSEYRDRLQFEGIAISVPVGPAGAAPAYGDPHEYDRGTSRSPVQAVATTRNAPGLPSSQSSISLLIWVGVSGLLRISLMSSMERHGPKE